MPPSLDTVPQEILEKIAYFCATSNTIGPPSGLGSLIATSRWTHNCLSVKSNPYLYRGIFAFKFDLTVYKRRLGTNSYISNDSLSQELQQRFICLKKLREGYGSQSSDSEHVGEPFTRRELLLRAYLLALENEGQNERQLREYARMDLWLKNYLFDGSGASQARIALESDEWPVQNEDTRLAMWLFWFLLKPEEYNQTDKASWMALNILKVYALGAHRYPLTIPQWTEFGPQPISGVEPTSIHYYAEPLRVIAPALSSPAILSFITLASQLHQQTNSATPSAPSDSCLIRDPDFTEWDCEWGRCRSLGGMASEACLTETFKPGSIQGVWEGRFTYTEFTSYGNLLSGGGPSVLTKSVVIKHRQTWKLREHHLLSCDVSTNGDREPECGTAPHPLSPGDPLRSYFPAGTQFEETDDGLKVHEPGKIPLEYRAAAKLNWDRKSGGRIVKNKDQWLKARVLDVIITGEGHSAWGQFSLVGRVRPQDGLISLSKNYIDGDRGKWLYRGYLVGNVNGSLAGRWRDTISPITSTGYEGCFTMTRRRDH
ncbi:hypothetical protein K435DRAFT_962385 [Dendrothele bispora CBS 962.96]|uniref:F-box domain-containing protein n=1 Tax=Dendrothele bispora (strain CBS 962.96) TaxID=1314807 RepID=A0A4S8MKY2_DENBC|nr:hypothetical protein K435DRAFT_962385 [Dendrothele bispora CBS 962.96]